MRNGHVFQRVLWEPAIKEIGGGLLRTPTVGMVNQDRSQDPQYMSKLLAKGQTVTLAAQMKSAEMLPTPTANYSKNSALPPSQVNRDGLAGAMLRDPSVQTNEATYLNPSFVEEMMGYPVGWTVSRH